MSKADVFDLSGVSLLAIFGYATWPPLAVLVLAVALLVAGRAAHRGGSQ